MSSTDMKIPIRITIIFLISFFLSLIGFIILREFWWSYIFIWPLSVFIYIYMVYFLNKPSWLGKNSSTGKISNIYSIVLFPYFLLTWINWYYQSWRKGGPIYQKISNQIYVGRYDSKGRDVELGKDTLIVDLTAEFSESVSEEISYIICKMSYDTWKSNMYQGFFTQEF